MRKRTITRKLVSSLLAFAMSISLVLPGFEPVATKAAETEIGEDAFAKLSFYDLQEDGILQVSGGATAKSYANSFVQSTQEEGETVTKQIDDKGAMISADAENVAGAKVSFARTFDFGDKVIDRVCINALAKRASATKLQIFVNDQEVPVCSAKLYNQIRDDNWTKIKPFCVDLSAANMTGVCELTIQFVTDKKEAGVNEDLEVLLRDIQFVEQSIPVVELNIDESQGTIEDMNKDEHHNTECYGKMSIRVPESYEAPYGGDYAGGTYELDYIRGRGNSTWQRSKKPYHIKLDKNADLFNMGKNKHWLLIANYLDNSLVRNRMTYWLGEKLGYEYTPKCLNVDVVMNGEYLGNYLLCEQIRVDENRLNIPDLEKAYEKAENPDDVDLSGGYFLSVSPYGTESEYGFLAHGSKFCVNSPESKYDTPLDDRVYAGSKKNGQGEGDTSDKINEPPVTQDHSPYEKANEYIKDYVTRVGDAIYAEDFKTEDGVSYMDLMDVDSAVSYYWMQEFSQNSDFYNTPSTYLYKKADVKDADGNVIENGKLYWGPLWDFDYVAWSSDSYSDYDDQPVFYDDQPMFYDDFDKQEGWFERLMQDPAFVEKVQAYWHEQLKPAMKEVIADGGLLDQYKEELAVSAKHNFEKWPNSHFMDEVPDYVNHAWEIDRLKNWIFNRIQWVDENVENIAPQKINIIFKNGDDIVLQTNGYVDHFLNDYVEEFPETPTKEGYVFSNWVCDCTDEYDGEVTIDQEIITDTSYITDKYPDENGNLIIYATFIAKEDIKDLDEILFVHKYYCTYYDEHDDDNRFSIDVLIFPEDATFTTLTWKSSDENVAYVYDGEVRVNGVGEATITAITPDGREYSVPLLVVTEEEYYDFNNMEVEIDQTEVTLKPGESQKLYIGHGPAILHCAHNAYEPYRWISLNPEVAVVDGNGYVQAVAPGKATILVVNTEDIAVLTCDVTVEEEKGDPVPVPSSSIKVGQKFTSGNLKYSVTACKGKNLQVQVIGKVKSKKTITIPSTVTFKKKKFKVTAIKASTFAKDKKISKLTIGKYVKKIGSKAFYKCKNLKKVKISSKVLKSVGKKAFSGISRKAKITVPKGMKKKYKKFFGKLTLK